MNQKYGWLLAGIVLINFGLINHAQAAQNSASTIAPQTQMSAVLRQQIIQAITDLADAPRKEWAVEISHYENEEGDITSSIERYTPNQEAAKQWSLIRINDKTPTDKQLKKFAKQKQEQAAKKAKGNSYSIDFKSLIKQDSLHLLNNNDSYTLVGFNVLMEDLGDDAEGKLDGTLSFNKQNNFIEEITIVNNAKFSPLFSASISDFALIFNFIKLNEVVLPQQINMQMKGSFAFFTEIDEVSTTTYSSYQQIGYD
ncbi:hypothetical protein [Thalassotalea atypica]|uniref:hypothetical protein n=1 Tax=Thalassotalea atypica TaxID=2054316 RepID=UPI002573F160|nr:hypothetical protein [Thalassotalea atypica]